MRVAQRLMLPRHVLLDYLAWNNGISGSPHGVIAYEANFSCSNSEEKEVDSVLPRHVRAVIVMAWISSLTRSKYEVHVYPTQSNGEELLNPGLVWPTNSTYSSATFRSTVPRPRHKV